MLHWSSVAVSSLVVFASASLPVALSISPISIISFSLVSRSTVFWWLSLLVVTRTGTLSWLTMTRLPTVTVSLFATSVTLATGLWFWRRRIGWGRRAWAWWARWTATFLLFLRSFLWLFGLFLHFLGFFLGYDSWPFLKLAGLFRIWRVWAGVNLFRLVLLFNEFPHCFLILFLKIFGYLFYHFR